MRIWIAVMRHSFLVISLLSLWKWGETHDGFFSEPPKLQVVTFCSQVQPECVGSWVLVSMRFYGSSLLHLKKLEKMKPWHEVERWNYVPLHSFWSGYMRNIPFYTSTHIGLLFGYSFLMWARTPRTWVEATAPLQPLLLGSIDRYISRYINLCISL